MKMSKTEERMIQETVQPTVKPHLTQEHEQKPVRSPERLPLLDKMHEPFSKHRYSGW